VPARRIKRTRRGFDVRLPEEERGVLRTLPDQMRALLDEGDRDDPVMRRLYPSAHLDDEAASAEFDAVTRDDLTDERRRSLDELIRTIDAPTGSAAGEFPYSQAVNDVRLVLGVRLAVTEETAPHDFDGDETAAASYALYAYLSYLEEEIVDALSG